MMEYTKGQLETMDGVALARVVAEVVMGWKCVDEPDGACSLSGDSKRRYVVVGGWGLDDPVFRPEKTERDSAEVKRLLVDKYGCHIEIVTTPSVTQIAIVPGRDFEWAGGVYRGKDADENRLICIMAVLAVQALGGGE